MMLLIVAAIVWLALHLGLAGTPLRDRLARPLGEQAFRGVFSLLSIAAIVFLVEAWNHAGTVFLWDAPEWLRWLLVFAMLPAFVLFFGSMMERNPTMIGTAAAAAQPPRGMIRITRHPMLWAFAIWAAVHVIGNGDTATIVFFGAFLVTALAGMPSIDAKLARRDPKAWGALSAATSIVPFAAIVQGRNRFLPGEVGWAAPLLGAVAWAAVLAVHRWVFGVAPVIL